MVNSWKLILNVLWLRVLWRISHWTTMRVECDRTHNDDESIIRLCVVLCKWKCLLRNHMGGYTSKTIFHARINNATNGKTVTLTTNSANSRSNSVFSGMGRVGVILCNVKVPELSTTTYVISGGSSSWKIRNFLKICLFSISL